MKYLTLLISIIVILAGCSNSDQQTKNNRLEMKKVQECTSISGLVDNTIKSVEESMYRSNTGKVQPELINVYFEKPDLDNILDWLSEAGNEITTAPTSTKSILIYSFSYEEKGKSETQKRLAYVIDNNNYVFLHVISDQMNRMINSFESFSNEDLNLIKNKIGNENWYKARALNIR
ncbi:hypothetical protein [Paenibacillus wynnii]|uniref:Lipoprotein n=1 Tax=Paenibacillus wynnii TaxID=268407 RepID=A0A098M2X0_9BACL|nr:hypothetical protein [Paenibacillus wynnii]KGE16815.1 hypothetical protein PWYN_19185 [Paenibacillus wynnii]